MHNLTPTLQLVSTTFQQCKRFYSNKKNSTRHIRHVLFQDNNQRSKRLRNFSDGLTIFRSN